LRIELSKRKRAMLVIDESLVAAAIADSEDRRRAIFEIGQGYSSADPYTRAGRPWRLDDVLVPMRPPLASVASRVLATLAGLPIRVDQ
jgi:hypothetical protein